MSAKLKLLKKNHLAQIVVGAALTTANLDKDNLVGMDLILATMELARKDLATDLMPETILQLVTLGSLMVTTPQLKDSMDKAKLMDKIKYLDKYLVKVTVKGKVMDKDLGDYNPFVKIL